MDAMKQIILKLICLSLLFLFVTPAKAEEMIEETSEEINTLYEEYFEGAEFPVPEQPDTGLPQLSLPGVARLLSELPLTREQVEEVHDAVTASAANAPDCMTISGTPSEFGAPTPA